MDYTPYHWAKLYADKGYPVVPVAPLLKGPKFPKWQMLDTRDQADFDKAFPPEYVGNIGVLLGLPLSDGSKLAVIDVDETDPAKAEYALIYLRNLLEDFSGRYYVVERKGTKAGAFFVRYTEDQIANVALDKSGNTANEGEFSVNIELLADRKQAVVPPSIYRQNLEEGFIDHQYQWTSLFKLNEIEPLELPLFTWEHWKEVNLLRMGKLGAIKPLAEAVYLGEGKGGGYHDILLKGVAAFHAHAFSDSYIYARSGQFGRMACRRGGVEDEFIRWDVEKEVRHMLHDAASKQARGQWVADQAVVSRGQKMEMQRLAYDISENDGYEDGITHNPRAPSRTLHGLPTYKIPKAKFNAAIYAERVLTTVGGYDHLWLQYATPGDSSSYRNDVLHRYEDGIWRQEGITKEGSLMRLGIILGIDPRQTTDVIQEVKSALINDSDMRPGRQDTLFEAGKRHLKLENATLNWETGEIVADRPENGCLYQLPIHWDPHAECPQYLSFLEEVLLLPYEYYEDLMDSEGSADTASIQTRRLADLEKAIGVFEEYCALTLVPNTDFQKSLFIRGRANTGKSTMLSILGLFHNKTTRESLGLSDLAEANARYALTNKLVNICPEIDMKEEFPAAAFKKIVEGADLSVKKLYANVGSAKPTARLVFAMNELPRALEVQNESIKRRMLVLVADNVVPADKRDLSVLRKLTKEKSGILNRWQTAYQRLMARQDFDPPAYHALEMQQFAIQNDLVSRFLHETSYEWADKETPVVKYMDIQLLFAAYKSYAEAGNYRHISTLGSFSDRLRRLAKDRHLRLNERMANGALKVLVPLLKTGTSAFADLMEF